MQNKKVQDEQWFKDLKIKGMTDYAGHYVELKQVDKNQVLWFIWNDGAITREGFKRDRLFNFLFRIVSFYRHNRFLIKLSFVCLIILALYLIIF